MRTTNPLLGLLGAVMLVMTPAAIAQCPGPCEGDINGDGCVDLSDLAALLARYGTCCEQAWTPDDYTVALWYLNRNGVDYSGNGNDLVIKTDRIGWVDDAPHCRGVIMGVDPWEGDCSHSDGGPLVTSNASCAYPGSGDWTVDAWVYFPSNSISYTILTHCSDGPTVESTYCLRIDAGIATFDINGTPVVSADVSSYKGAWFHLAAVYRYQESVALRANDAQLALEQTSEVPQNGSSYHICVGGTPCGSSTGLKVDEVRVSNISRPAHRLVVANYGDQSGENPFLSRFAWPSGDCVGPSCLSDYMQYPGGMAYGPDGLIYIAGGQTHKVLWLNAITCEFGEFASGAPLSHPMSVTFGPDNDLYAVNYTGGQVIHYDWPSGTVLDPDFLVDDPNNPDDIPCSPIDLTFGPDSNLYVTSTCDGTDRVHRYNGETGDHLGHFVATGSGGLDHPNGIRFGADGNLYVVSGSTNQILAYSGSNGTFDHVFTEVNLNSPRYLDFGPDGNVYITNIYGNNVTIYDRDTGEYIGEYSGCELDRPTGLAFLHLE